MSEPTIPVALGPGGSVVPIEEAERFKTNYYQCPECGEVLNPRKGDKRMHYFAHKRGSLEDTACSLSSQADVDELVDELRTSDVEKEEKARQIRTQIGESPGGRLRFFGVVPSLSWDDVPKGVDVGSVLESTSVRTKGVTNPPISRNFHPSEPEVFFELDPECEEYILEIEGDDRIEALAGEWTASKMTEGDLFVGDQSRALRRRAGKQIKKGEWVYLVISDLPEDLPEVVNSESIGSWNILSFPAREETESLLDAYGEGLTTDKYGFDADVILPAHSHPTSEAPIEGVSEQTTLISIRPSPEINPTFEVVSIPKRTGSVVEIPPTGPGNPRYYTTEFPPEGSRRVSIHQQNSSRHRLIHLHSVDEKSSTGGQISIGEVGIRVDLDDREYLLVAQRDQSGLEISEQGIIASLPSRVSYVGPEGLRIEYTARFGSDSPHGTQITRSTTDLEQAIPEIGQWAMQGCKNVVFDFDGLGTVEMSFDQAEPANGDPSEEHTDRGTR